MRITRSQAQWLPIIDYCQ